jgi:hypothetical protein
MDETGAVECILGTLAGRATQARQLGIGEVVSIHGQHRSAGTGMVEQGLRQRGLATAGRPRQSEYRALAAGEQRIEPVAKDCRDPVRLILFQGAWRWRPGRQGAAPLEKRSRMKLRRICAVRLSRPLHHALQPGTRRDGHFFDSRQTKRFCLLNFNAPECSPGNSNYC